MNNDQTMREAFEKWADAERPSLYKNVTTYGDDQIEIHAISIAWIAWQAALAQPDAPARVLSDAARDVLAERQRQVAIGYDHAHDDEHTESEMALAAGCYALSAGGYAKGQTPPIWPWSLTWWKPAYGRRDLVRAGALILAEIERLDRAILAASTGAPKT